MRQPNWSGYASESAADAAAEDRIGAYTVEPPIPEEDAALSLELARENAEGVALEEWDDDDPRYFCAHCDGPSLPDEKDDEGYCLDCQRAMSETHASAHPRPEEVG